MIDEYPIVFIAAAFASGVSIFKGLGELKVKESNRLKVMYETLKILGVKVKIGENQIQIEGSKNYTCEAKIKTFDDHRIAMSSLIFGIASNGSVEIDDMSMIATSFPNFKKTFEELVQKLNSFKSLKPVIAIDGTAGSKGTLAKKLAKFIKFDHLDTGILYRICALEMLERKVDIQNIDIQSWLNNKKELTSLRTEKISKQTSKISKMPNIRKFLLKFQRDFAKFPPNGLGSVVDGRDIGSVVFLMQI